MKRVLMGIVWFIVLFIVLYIIFSIVLGVMIAHNSGVAATADYHQSLEAGIAYAREHATALAIWRAAIVVVAILLAVIGTLGGWLPGTRKKSVATS